MSGLVTYSSNPDVTTAESDPFEESLKTTSVTCSISAAVAYFCIAGIICGMGMTGVKTHIHWNVCVALIISNVLLLVGSEREPGSIECKAVSIATQFFNLASQTWTTIEVIHLFRLSSDARQKSTRGDDLSDRITDKAAAVDRCDDAQSVSGTDKKGVPSSAAEAKSTRVWFCYVIGWIMPAVFVAATTLPALESYGKSYKCWIVTDNEIVWLFVAPTVALFIFHCAATSATINNARRNNATRLNDLNASQFSEDTQDARESVSMNEGSEQGTIFVHPPLHVVSEERMTIRMPADEETNKNLSLITHWNFSVLPLISATWCLWISALTVRMVVLLYITCAISVGQVVYLFIYYCVITFRLERRKRFLRRRKMNEDARPVTIVFGDDDDDVKTSNKQKKIQNIELMLRTPTPFPIREPTMPRHILPPGQAAGREEETPRYESSSHGFHDYVEWDDDQSTESINPHESAQKEGKTKDESFNRMFNNRVKLEAYVNVGARLVIDDTSRSPSSGSYKFEYNRPASRSQGIMARRSITSQDYDLSARVDAEKLSRSLVCSAVDEHPKSDPCEERTRLPFST